MTTTSATSIRNVQYSKFEELLVDMLNCNLPDSDPSRPIWKLFIMDRTAQRIVSPVLKVNDLREHGVTLFLHFSQEREAVREVPAVYFVEPSSENLARICQDLKNNLYEAFYLNFTSYVSRDGLEQLAQASVSSSSHVKIAQVYDQYLNYISLEDSLFTLEIPRVLPAILSAQPDARLVDQLSSGLFSVCMSFGGLAPVICALKPAQSLSDSVASMSQAVATRLESRIKSHLINTKSALAMTPQSNSSPSASRPLLIVADRLVDLSGPIKHSSAYNALIDDILGLQGNKVTLPAPVSKSFDIDMRDWIWRDNATRPFPNVAEAVESALKAYKADYDRVMQTTPGMTEELMKQSEGSSSLTPEQLKVAINVLPELTERKRLIDTHLQISTALLDAIKTRDLGNLFHLEQSIATLTPGALMNALRDPKIGNGRDKLRLLLVFLLTRGFGACNVEEAVKLCEVAGCSAKELGIVPFIKTLNLHLESVSTAANNTATAAPTAANDASIGDFLSRLSAGGGAVLGSLVSSVKNLLPVVAETPLSRLIDRAFALATGQSTATLSPLNSPLGSPSDPSASLASRLQLIDPRPKAVTSVYSIDHVILVMLGGAAYSEFDQLLEHFSKARHLQSVKFTFGTDEMVNADRFLQDLIQ